MRMNTGLKIAAVFRALLFQITLKAQTMKPENQNLASIFPKGEKATQNFTKISRILSSLLFQIYVPCLFAFVFILSANA